MQNFHYSIFITQFLSLITHHFKILHLFGTITQLPSLNIFHTVCRPYICHSVQLFSFFFYQYLETRKKKRPNPGEERKERKKKKSKKTQGRPNPGEKKKKKQTGQKVRLSYDQWVPHVCLITKISLSYELRKFLKKKPKMYFQFS